MDGLERIPRPARPPDRRRGPRVAGVSGGCGTTTLAAALGASDCGIYQGGQADVLVCRATGDALVRAGQVAAVMPIAQPVVAVLLGTSVPATTVSARIRLLGQHASRVVLVPHVRRWDRTASPLDEARALPGISHGDEPRHLRPFRRAVDDLRTALDQPRHPTTPAVSTRAAARHRVERTR